MKKLLFFIVIFFLSQISGICQKDLSPKEIFRDAEFFFDREEFEEAVYLFKQLAKDQPENANLQFRIGMSYLNIPGREKMAIPYLEEAVKNTTRNYKERDFNEKEAPHHAWFYLGRAYRINNQLNEALETYHIFKDIRNFERKYNLRITENEIQSCQRAKIIQDSPIILAKYNPGPVINSTVHNFNPVVTPDESIMVFMQRLKFYDAIMYTYKKEGEWVSPINITAQIGSDGDMVPTGISADGKELLLVKENSYDNKDIYYSRLEGDFWSTAVEISKKINTIRNEDHASFSPDGKTILISSDRRGGYGKLDIYKSERLENGEWTTPVNLGPVINTEEDETSAYLMMNNQHLYFSSTGHFNMGGYDIFFSENQDEEWTDPVNLGYPLNTTRDDRRYYPVKQGNAGYMSLFGENENIHEEDIYRIQMAPLAKIPRAPASLSNKNFILVIKDPETGEIIRLKYDKKKDEFLIDSERFTEFKLKISEE